MALQETESIILAAARAEFIENGLKGARMQAIADRAGLNKALLHYYFRSKEKLYEAALSSVIQEVLGSLQMAMSAEGAGPLELGSMIERVVRSYTQVLRSNPDFPRLVMRELADGGNAFASVVRDSIPDLARIRTMLADQPGVEALGGYEHLMISMMSLVAGTFVFQPWYMQVLPAVGVELVLDEAFYEKRIRSILTILRGGVTGHAQK